MNRKFTDSVREILDSYSDTKPSAFTKNEFAALPEPVKQYLDYCGFAGKEKMQNAKIVWSEAKHKRSVRSNWMRLSYFQFNSVPEPVRIVDIKGKLGIMSMSISEKYQNGMGIWQMKIANKFTLIDAKNNEELNRSALVTFLSEALLIPSIALQPYIQWYPIDELSARAVISHNGNVVSGSFFFNKQREFIRFETEDRFNSEDGKLFSQCKWSGICSHYAEKNGVKFPTAFKAVWHLDNQDFEYFNGNINEIIFNVK